MRILALTVDLDDTLWPVMPALEQADQDVDNYLREHHPEVAARWPIAAMRELRASVAVARPDLAHDFTTQRHITMRQAFEACGVSEVPLETLWEIYFSARNRVELYPDALPALQRMSALLPVVSITNGNADLNRIGLHLHFAHQLSARDVGCPKPQRRIFDTAAEKLGVAPENILHIGDDAALDVVGAREAGLRTAWVNREAQPWPVALGPEPDLTVHELGQLADWLEANTVAP